MPIRTPRLTLRPPRPGDGTALAEAVAESYDDLHPWLHRWMGPRGREADPRWQEVVACRDLARFEAREWLRFLAWSATGTLIASVELIHPDWRRGAFELAYWVRSGAHRRGYGTEAACGLARYAFGALEARLVTVSHSALNEGSARLIARLGFDRVSRTPLGSELADGTFVDSGGHAMTDGAALPPLDVRWGG